MDQKEARALVERCLPRFEAAGLPQVDAASISKVSSRSVARLWGGMGNVYEISVSTSGGPDFSIIAKRIQLPARCSSIGDKRKKDSYDVEAAFYSRGHAEKLIAAGCIVPFPLLVENSRGDGLTICMTKLDGRGRGMDVPHVEAVLSWLAGLHATFWGPRADVACSDGPEGGLQQQGCYWYLDTRPEEHEDMPESGWEGRLKHAARAIDERLKADPLQSVCHGDAKSANIIFATGGDKSSAPVPLLYDFQYCGKAPVTKDLAYLFNVASDDPRHEERLLQFYHRALSERLQAQGDTPPSMEALRASLDLSYCDLARFLVSFGFWGHDDIRKRTRSILDRLDGGKRLKSEAEYAEALRREFPIGA